MVCLLSRMNQDPLKREKVRRITSNTPRFFHCNKNNPKTEFSFRSLIVNMVEYMDVVHGIAVQHS